PPEEDGPYYLFLRRPILARIGWVLTSVTCNFLACWSRDPSGQSVFSLEEEEMIGLPEISLEGKGDHVQFSTWSKEVYDFIKKYQELKGFDPSTSQFARSLGLPILEI
ncbi:hypothetical protein L218DRAFT_841226, partial [Marasmius fiardii PR-910]